MFTGGDASVPVGGAGAVEYYIADALSRDPRLRVVWVFPPGFDVSGLSHSTIEIREAKPLIRRGVPIVSRRINWDRLAAPFVDPGPRVVFGPPFCARSSRQWHAAVRSGAQQVIRVANDADILDYSSSGLSEYLRDCIGDTSLPTPQVVVHSQWQRDQMLKLVGEDAGSSVHLIPKGWYSPAERPAWEGRRHILWVGSCQPLKQPWVFLVLAQLFPQERFVMVMPPFLGERDRFYRSIVHEASSIPNLLIIGEQIPIGDVDALFRDAKIYVMTSQWEGFANTLLQAGAAGTPIASLHVDPDGYISSRGAGFSTNGSIPQLIDGIRSLLADGESGAARAGAASWEYVRTEHSMERAAVELTDVILLAAAGGGTGSR